MVDNYMVLYNEIQDYLKTYHVCVHCVPSLGNSAIRTTPKVVAGNLVANYQVSKFIGIPAVHMRNKKPKKDHLFNWSQ